MYGDYGVWIRPVNMFFESIEYNGKTIPRFVFIKETMSIPPIVRK